MAFNTSLANLPSSFNLHMAMWVERYYISYTNSTSSGDNDGDGTNDDYDDSEIYDPTSVFSSIIYSYKASLLNGTVIG